MRAWISFLVAVEVEFMNKTDVSKIEVNGVGLFAYKCLHSHVFVKGNSEASNTVTEADKTTTNSETPIRRNVYVWWLKTDNLSFI